MKRVENDTKQVKKCSKCKIEKELDQFGKLSKSKDKHNSYCKKCKSNYDKQWNQNNKEHVKNYTQITKPIKQKYQKEYDKHYKPFKYKNDPKHKLSLLLRTSIHKHIKRNKLESSNILLGCTIGFYKNYLESLFKPEMNWSNHGTVWEIDHIIPLVKFDLTKLSEQKKCFNYKNTQPLFSTTEIAESFGYKNEIGNKNKADL